MVRTLGTTRRLTKQQTRLGEVLATVYWFGDGAAATVVVDGVLPGFYCI
jgi:3-oxoacyl-[acyl-carrier-protein] synthase III